MSLIDNRISKLERDVSSLRKFTLESFSKDNKTSKPSNDETLQFSGFIIISLLDPIISKSDDLRELSKKYNKKGLAYFLDEHKTIETRRLIHSLSPDKLLELEKRALKNHFKSFHSLTSYWRLDCRTISDVDKIVQLLQHMSEIDFAYPELVVSEPSVDASDDTYAADQDYLDAAPDGVDARWAWTQTNGNGTGVGCVDLEQGWFLSHEDLPNPTLIFNDNKDGVGTYKGNHGTAVLGEIVGVDNDRGIVGIAPAATARVVSHYESASDTNLHVADAIIAAVDVMPVGDVLLLEVQRGFDPYPTETDMADFDAIRLATALGIIVVEAAGNGNNDLDAWVDPVTGDDRLNRTSNEFLDSGAIMVGSSDSDVETDNGHNRLGTSNYGSRIDCYGWGTNIVTAGYGFLDPGTGDDSTYTDSFGGTSGASPMIVGVALIVQSIYENNAGNRLSSGQMRALLSDPALGTPQSTTGIAGNINVMPNLRQIIQTGLGLVPDIYIRDSIADNGDIPSVGAISASPDIIVVPNMVADKDDSFGEFSGTENSNILGYEVESGQDNYIYARMKNRGTDDEVATTTIFWSEVSTLVTPDMWNLIGTTNSINVPQGDTLVVTDPLTWNANAIPGTGHYCFVSLIDSARDPAPPLPSAIPAFDWDAFLNYIRNHNNVTWRNFNVIDAQPDPAADPMIQQFLVSGAFDKRRKFDLEIQQRLPKESAVVWEIPLDLYLRLRKQPSGKIKINKKEKIVEITLPSLKNIYLNDIVLEKSAHHKCRFIIKGSKGLKNGWHYVSIRQIYENFEVGRVTVAIGTREKDSTHNCDDVEQKKKY